MSGIHIKNGVAYCIWVVETVGCQNDVGYGYIDQTCALRFLNSNLL